MAGRNPYAARTTKATVVPATPVDVMTPSKGSFSVAVVVALTALMLVYEQSFRRPQREDETLHAVRELQVGENLEELRSATELLAKRGAAGLGKLKDALESAETRHPERIVDAIAQVGGAEALPELRLAAESFPDPLARLHAVEALERLHDVASVSLLQRIADSDACLQVAQRAVIASAALGSDELLPDLATLLEPATLEPLRERAAVEFARWVGHAGGADVARRWLAEHGGVAPASAAGGAHRADGEPIAIEGPPALSIRRCGASLEFEVTGTIELPLAIVLDLGGDAVTIDVEQRESGIVATALDLPRDSAPLPRTAPIAVARDGDVLRFALPRVGRLVDPAQPRGVDIVRASR